MHHIQLIVVFVLFAYSFLSTVNSRNFIEKNVIIFFTKPDVDLSCSLDDSGIQFLKFPVKGFLKSYCLPKKYTKSVFLNNINPDCSSIFNEYLNDLLEWAITKKHMATAIISSDDSSSSILFQKSSDPNQYGSYEMYKYCIRFPPISRKRQVDLSQSPDNPNFNLAKYRKILKNTIGLRIPSATTTTVKPLPPMPQPVMSYGLDNDIFGFKSLKQKLGQTILKNNVKLLLRGYGFENDGETFTSTSPVTPFSIKNSSTTTIKSKIFNLDNNANRNMFKALAPIYNAFYYIFANSLLNPNDDVDENFEENDVDTSRIGKREERPMLVLIQQTIKRLKRMTTSRNPIQGFLLIVIGGEITDVANPFSDLMQSVKYVTEHTDKRNTLTIVTCYCNKLALQNTMRDDQYSPYYVNGMDHESFDTLENTWDLFNKTKKSLVSLWRKAKIKLKEKGKHNLKANNLE